MIIDTINSDLKTAMLARDKPLVDTLKGLKTAVQYLSVAKGVNDQPSEDEIIALLKKEQKKRTEASELYQKANEAERSAKELYEKQIIDQYLPASLDDAEVKKIVDQEIQRLGGLDSKNMGQIIGAAKKACGPSADGATIARIVKESL